MKYLVTILSSLLLLTPQLMLAQLGPGSVMFIGYNADGTDGFSIVALEDLPANTNIHFNDNEWNGGAPGSTGAFLSSTEWESTWNVGTGAVSAGTVINFTNMSSSPSVTVGTVSGQLDANASNEVIYCFLGPNNTTPTTFLTAIANDGYSTSKGTLDSTGLSAGATAVSISGDEDVMVYNSDTICNVSLAACAAMIANPANWITQDGAGDQSNDGVSPNFPAHVKIQFFGTALPVSISYFNGTLQSNKVILEWATVFEQNAFEFIIEKSMDGKTWMPIGRLNANGNSNEFIPYSFVDVEAKGLIQYYRLAQIDYNGMVHFSKTVLVQISTSNKNNLKTVFYPNPAHQNLTILKSKSSKVTVLSGEGQIVQTITSCANCNIDLSRYSKGIYWVQTIENGTTERQKLIIE